MRLDSASVGDPSRFLALAELEARLPALAAPRERGRVTLLVSRGEGGVRETPARVLLTPERGMPGDAWERRTDRKPEAQLAVMQHDVGTLVANGQPLTLFGDNLVLDLDLSTANLPIGSRLAAGGALFEVTPKPHNGCTKFRARFGEDALRFVSMPPLRHRNLRGIYLRVVEAGDVAVGDAIEVLSRAAT
jgi:hypothetical protein